MNSTWHDLTHENPSVGRFFDHIELLPMSSEECEEIVQKALHRSDPPVEIDDIVVKEIIHHAKGYPYIVQLIGRELYITDNDNYIGYDDLQDAWPSVKRAVVNTMLSAYSNKIDDLKEEDNQVLQILAQTSVRTLSELRKFHTIASIDTLQSYLKPAIEREILRESNGYYEFTNDLLRVYYAMPDAIVPLLEDADLTDGDEFLPRNDDSHENEVDADSEKAYIEHDTADYA